MKVLIICSYREYLDNGIPSFVSEQYDSLINKGIYVTYFLVRRKGIRGYLLELFRLRDELKKIKQDVIHAHGGMCGLLANLQRKIPVVTTYHGSDINDINSFKYSLISIWLSRWNIFVSEKMLNKARAKSKCSVIPCAINTDIFYHRDKGKCREYFKFNVNKTYILFSKAFHVKVKNYPLAKAAVDKIKNAELIELHGYSREEVAMLMNACDLALMTSFSEGSPQFVKEAIACGCPVVSTDVGDISEIAKNIESIFICHYKVDDVIEKIHQALNLFSRGKPVVIEKYKSEYIANKIIDIYKLILDGKC